MQAPSVQTASTAAYSAAVLPSAQTAVSGITATRTQRQLPTSSDLANLAEGLVTALGRRLLAEE